MYNGPVILIVLTGMIAIIALVLVVLWGVSRLPDDTFGPECAKVGGHVYVMDADHRVCIVNGKVVKKDG